MTNFEIDDAYLVSITTHKVWYMKYDDTEEGLIEALRGAGRCSSTSSEDHPKFKALREQLSKDGYIAIQRGWWNGDTVTKPFTLNGKQFRVNETFPSAAAMSGHLKYML